MGWGTGGTARRLSLVSVAAALVCLGSTGVPSAGAAIFTPDGGCPGPATNNLGSYQAAQTFTSLHTGPLVRVDAVVYNTAGSYPHIFEIRSVASGFPSDQVLASTSISAAAMEAVVPVGQNGTISMSFTSPAAVQAGQTYALVYSRVASNGVFGGTVAAASCPLMVFRAGPTQPFKANQENESWVFTTYVTTETCGGKSPTMVGTADGDTLKGTRKSDVILGLGGDDTIKGLGGKDLICGGAGDDTLVGGAGADRLFGQKGRDSHRGGGGSDLCQGGKGADSTSGCEVEKAI